MVLFCRVCTNWNNPRMCGTYSPAMCQGLCYTTPQHTGHLCYIVCHCYHQMLEGFFVIKWSTLQVINEVTIVTLIYPYHTVSNITASYCLITLIWYHLYHMILSTLSTSIQLIIYQLSRKQEKHFTNCVEFITMTSIVGHMIQHHMIQLLVKW